MSVVYWTWQQKDHWFARLQDQIARSWVCHHFCRANHRTNQSFVTLQFVDATSVDNWKTKQHIPERHQWSFSPTWMIKHKYHMIQTALPYSTNQKLLKPCFADIKSRRSERISIPEQRNWFPSNFHNFQRGTFALLELFVVKDKILPLLFLFLSFCFLFL